MRRAWHVNIMAVKRDGAIDAGISPATRLDPSMTILLIGRNDDIQRVLKL